MSLSKALDDALDEARDSGQTSGTVHADAGERRAEVELVDVDRLGVRVRKIRVQRDTPYDVERVAEAWPRELRDLPDRIHPVEVDPRLGGATLRSRPDEMRGDSFIDIEVRGGSAEVRRRVRHRGEAREEGELTFTREQLGRVVDDLARGGSDER